MSESPRAANQPARPLGGNKRARTRASASARRNLTGSQWLPRTARAARAHAQRFPEPRTGCAMTGPVPLPRNAGCPARVRSGRRASRVAAVRGGFRRAAGAAGLVRPRARDGSSAPLVRQRPSEGPPPVLHARTSLLIAAVTLWSSKQPELCHWLKKLKPNSLC